MIAAALEAALEAWGRRSRRAARTPRALLRRRRLRVIEHRRPVLRHRPHEQQNQERDRRHRRGRLDAHQVPAGAVGRPARLLGLRSRGRRDAVHRLRSGQGQLGHRPADRPSGPRPEPERRPGAGRAVPAGATTPSSPTPRSRPSRPRPATAATRPSSRYSPTSTTAPSPTCPPASSPPAHPPPGRSPAHHRKPPPRHQYNPRRPRPHPMGGGLDGSPGPTDGGRADRREFDGVARSESECAADPLPHLGSAHHRDERSRLIENKWYSAVYLPQLNTGPEASNRFESLIH